MERSLTLGFHWNFSHDILPYIAACITPFTQVGHGKHVTSKLLIMISFLLTTQLDFRIVLSYYCMPRSCLILLKKNFANATLAICLTV